MTKLAELHPRKRREKVGDAIEGVLRQLEEPCANADFIKRVAQLLGAEKEQSLVARDVVTLSRTHPQARETGETFQKYGRTMTRREWFPSRAKLTSSEIERRRAIINENEWAIGPEEFLEDQNDQAV